MNPMIALWAHPRSLSTALERSFIERGDFAVFHEPFAYVYYMHENRADIPHKHPDPDHPKTFPEIRDMMETARAERPVFHKDMCYHCMDHLLADPAFLRDRINTFIIRDPAEAILSHATIHPGVRRENLGYEQMHRVFETVADLTGTPPIVVNAEDLQTDPGGMLRSYCEAVGIPFVGSALQWRPGERKEWSTWREWHTGAASSGGLGKAPRRYSCSFEDTPHLRDFLDYCLPFYRALDRHRLPPAKETAS